MFPILINNLINATLETLYMVFLSGAFALVFGIPLAILLYATRPSRVWGNQHVYRILDVIVNVGRSFPFFILMIALIPFTRLLVGTSIGTNAATVSLTIAAIPFIARLFENAFNEVAPGLIEAANAMGASPLQIYLKVLIPESLPSMINATTIMLISLVGYSAMAGAIGGGGLGSMAFNYGYQRFDTQVMVLTIILLIIIVQCIQWIGDKLAHRLIRH